MRPTLRSYVPCIALLGLSLAASACEPRRASSPFDLWTLRPGDSLSVASERVQRLAGKPLECVAVVNDARVCRVRSPGAPLTAVPGALSFLVDSAGTVVVLRFERGDGYVPTGIQGQVRQEWTDELGRLAAGWSAVKGSAKASAERQRQWVSGDSAWLAAIAEGVGDIPAAIEVRSRPGMAAVLEGSPLARFALATHGIVAEGVTLDDVVDDIITMGERPAVLRLVVPRDTALQPCELELADIIVEAGAMDRDARGTLSEAGVALLERVVPVAYPGWRIVFGQHAYLVGPNGVAERVRVLSSRAYATHPRGPLAEIHAFSLVRERRVDVAQRRLAQAARGAWCRSAADVVLVHTEGDRIVDAVPVVVDEEAPWSEMVALDFVFTGDSEQLLASYRSGYAGGGWNGELGWRAVIALDPPRLVARVPTRFEQRRSDDPESTRRSGILFTALDGERLTIATFEENERGSFTRSTRLNLGSGATVSGAALLAAVR